MRHPRKWRFMLAGEIVQRDDEFLNGDGHWVPVRTTIGCTVNLGQERDEMFRTRRGYHYIAQNRSTVALVRLRAEKDKLEQCLAKP